MKSLIDSLETFCAVLEINDVSLILFFLPLMSFWWFFVQHTFFLFSTFYSFFHISIAARVRPFFSCINFSNNSIPFISICCSFSISFCKRLGPLSEKMIRITCLFFYWKVDLPRFLWIIFDGNLEKLGWFQRT